MSDYRHSPFAVHCFWNYVNTGGWDKFGNDLSLALCLFYIYLPCPLPAPFCLQDRRVSRIFTSQKQGGGPQSCEKEIVGRHNPGPSM
jgi:hypothetical protein